MFLSGDNTNGWVLTATYDGAPGTPIDFVPGDSATVDLSGTISYCVTPGLVNGQYRDDHLDQPQRRLHINSTLYPIIRTHLERTGADGVGGLLNDYASEGVASVMIDLPINSKYIISTSEISTGVVNGYENTAIGEIVRYRVSFLQSRKEQVLISKSGICFRMV